jgi:hypothetical protein
MFQLRAGSNHSVSVFGRHLMSRSNFSRRSIVFEAESSKDFYFSQLCGAAAVLFGKSKPTSGFDLGGLDKTWLLNVPAGQGSHQTSLQHHKVKQIECPSNPRRFDKESR